MKAPIYGVGRWNMKQIESIHKPGTVGYIQANRPRFQKFYDCLEQLEVPNGTALMRASNYNAAHNRNEIVCSMEGDWILFLDDDHAFESSALTRLLNHNVDIVTGLYCRRYAPFESVIYKTFDPVKHEIELYSWEDLSEMSGLIEIGASGAGFLLVRKKVLENMDPPYFRVGGSHWREWELEKDVIGEDTGFCWRARELGYKVHCDIDVSIAHIPDETLLVPMRQPNNGAFNIMHENGEHRVFTLAEQQRKKRLHLA